MMKISLKTILLIGLKIIFNKNFMVKALERLNYLSTREFFFCT